MALRFTVLATALATAGVAARDHAQGPGCGYNSALDIDQVVTEDELAAYGRYA
jgi:hypothetical protein